MKKRSLSLLLALLMVLSLVMPGTAAFADTVSAETPADASDTVLKWTNKLGTDWMNAPSDCCRRRRYRHGRNDHQ